MAETRAGFGSELFAAALFFIHALVLAFADLVELDPNAGHTWATAYKTTQFACGRL
jgi:hypothetical protein